MRYRRDILAEGRKVPLMEFRPIGRAVRSSSTTIIQVYRGATRADRRLTGQCKKRKEKKKKKKRKDILVLPQRNFIPSHPQQGALFGARGNGRARARARAMLRIPRSSLGPDLPHVQGK